MNQTKEETIHERFKFGTPVFLKLFEMPSKELKAKLKEICAPHLPKNKSYIFKMGVIIKTIREDEPFEIQLYPHLSVNALGINLTPQYEDIDESIGGVIVNSKDEKAEDTTIVKFGRDFRLE